MKKPIQVVTTKHTRFVVPLAICQQVVRTDFSDEFQFFLFLKSICEGNLRLNAAVRQTAARVLGCSERTVKRRFDRLLERNWIGRYKKCNVYILRSFNALFRVEGLGPFRTGVEFLIEDLKNVKAFVAGACIGHIARYLRTKKWRACQPGNKKARPYPPDTSLRIFQPVACKFIAEWLDVAVSTASELKRLAYKHGYIDIKKQVTPIPFKNRAEYARQGYENANRIVYWDGRYYLQETDLVAPMAHYKTRRKAQFGLKKNGQLPKDNKSAGLEKPTSISAEKYERMFELKHQK